MKTRTIKFPFSNNRGQKLAGVLDLPEGEPLLYGVFAACFTCTKESHGAHKVCRALSNLGIAMLRFDLPGLGESEGIFAETNFSTRISDIAAACNALAAAYEAPKLLVGHSAGGTASIAASVQLPSLQAVATIGSTAWPSHVVEGLRRNNAIKIEGDIAEMIVAGRKVIVKKQMIEDMETYEMDKALAAFNRKLFIFHAPHDDIVPFRNAEIIYNSVNSDKELVRLNETATHLLEQGAGDADFIAETLRGWFDLHLQG
jgi:putative redox protein